jgi:hypothetical protein
MVNTQRRLNLRAVLGQNLTRNLSNIARGNIGDFSGVLELYINATVSQKE